MGGVPRWLAPVLLMVAGVVLVGVGQIALYVGVLYMAPAGLKLTLAVGGLVGLVLGAVVLGVGVRRLTFAGRSAEPS